MLEAAQARVDEAFRPNGQPKRGANDPFRKAAEEVAVRQKERDEAELAAGSGRLLAQRLADFQRDAAAADGELQEAMRERDGLDQRRARQGALAGAGPPCGLLDAPASTA